MKDEKNKTEDDQELERKEKAKQRRSRTNFRQMGLQKIFQQKFNNNQFQFGTVEQFGETV